ncbi:hypothetical protein FRC07_001140 [Ceratobasidium sp. 392]|nr:hypothetical protein FRC07_001140 [Ceratobasidium sp. 392]
MSQNTTKGVRNAIVLWNGESKGYELPTRVLKRDLRPIIKSPPIIKKAQQPTTARTTTTAPKNTQAAIKTPAAITTSASNKSTNWRTRTTKAPTTPTRASFDLPDPRLKRPSERWPASPPEQSVRHGTIPAQQFEIRPTYEWARLVSLGGRQQQTAWTVSERHIVPALVPGSDCSQAQSSGWIPAGLARLVHVSSVVVIRKELTLSDSLRVCLIAKIQSPNLSACCPVGYGDDSAHSWLPLDGTATTWDYFYTQNNTASEDDGNSSEEDAPALGGNDSADAPSDTNSDLGDSDDLYLRECTSAGPPADQPPDLDQHDDDGWETESEIGDVPEEPVQSAQYARFPSTTLSKWRPFPTKAMYLADLICHSRRVHFGRTHIRAILEYARQTQGEKIPSYHALRKFQKLLKARVGDPTQRCVSSQDTVYYVNDVSEGVKQDVGNPLARPHMTFVPQVNGKRMSQAWHGRKMVHNVDDKFLTPCIRHNGRIFYVNELVRRCTDWFIPLRWVTVGPDCELHAIGHHVVQTSTGLDVVCAERKTVKVSTFLESFPELQTRKAVPAFDEKSANFRSMMPHPLRSTAGSRLVYSIPLIVFMDDASGNISNQWNKHWSCYLSNAALPREELQHEYHVRYVSTSSHASPSEMMEGIRASVEKAFENPTVAYDCVTHEEVLIRPFALFWAGDNPMQAEHCSSSGLNSSHFCRTCDVGGSDSYKQSLEGYRTLFAPGNRRLPSETRRVIDERFDMAILPKTIQKVKNHTRDTGVKDSMAQPVIDSLIDLGKSLRNPAPGTPRRSPQQIENILQEELARVRSKCVVNPLLTMPGVNIHRDTPTEILHTVLLGVVKYFWGQSVFILGKEKKLSLLESRLASTNISGMDLPNFSASYMCQYRGSLIGKHFKALVQLMVFACYDILPPLVLEAWQLLGRLSCLLWYTEIEDINSYTEELQSVISDFLLVTAQCSPSIIVLKPKFHFLVHLPSYIRRFGPALLFSTERFESFNGVFRAASMFSNRHAPSRDISQRFGDLDRVKHIASGGYWFEDNSWVRASASVLEFISTNKVFSQLIGMPKKKDTAPGEAALLGCAPPVADGSQYFHVLSTIATSGDSIKAGDNILSGDHQFARVEAVLGCISGFNQRSYFVAARLYAFDLVKHTILDLPVLVQSQDIICIAVEHDCARRSACTNTRAVYEVQEREQTSKLSYRMQHSDDNAFVLNLYAFHNAQVIRKAVPNHLYTRRTRTTDPEVIFSAAVEKLSVAKIQKARIAAAKRTAKGVVAEAMDAVSGHAGEDGKEGEEGEEGITVADIIGDLLPVPQKTTKRRAKGNSGATASTGGKRKKHMVANPGVYGITEAVQERFIHSKEFSSAVGDVFSGFRSEMKRKTEKGSEEGMDIYSLCHTLVPRGFQLTEEHALRLSLVRIYLNKYNGITWKAKDKEKKPFWDWFDTRLEDFHQLSEEKQTRKLQKNLRLDLRQYPVPPGNMSSFPPVACLPPWQVDVSITVAEMLDDYYNNLSLVQNKSTTRATNSVTPGTEHGRRNGPDGERSEPSEDDRGLGGHHDNGGDGDDETGDNDKDTAGHGGYPESDDDRAGGHQTRRSSTEPHSMDTSPDGHVTHPGHSSSSNGLHRRGAHDGIGPVRTDPLVLRPSPLPSRNVASSISSRNSTPSAPSRNAGSASTARRNTRQTTSGAQSSQASQSLGQTSYTPTGSETAMATLGWGNQ